MEREVDKQIKVTELLKEIDRLKKKIEELTVLLSRYKSSYKKLYSVFHSIPDAVLIIDAKTEIILEVNKGTETILGYTSSMLKGKHFSVLFSPVTNITLDGLLDGTVVYGSVFIQEFKKADGSYCTVDLTANMIACEDKVIILAIIRDVTERIKIEKEKEELMQRLEEAIKKIKVLNGLLPICAWCKKIRDDKGYWHQVEVYIKEHSNADFTHGICPDCAKKLGRNIKDPLQISYISQ